MSKPRVPVEYLAAFTFGQTNETNREIVGDDVAAFKLLRKAEAGDEQARADLLWLAKFNSESVAGYFKGGKSAPRLHATEDQFKATVTARNKRRSDVFYNQKHYSYFEIDGDGESL